MIALALEKAAGLHPWGTLDELYQTLENGEFPAAESGARCSEAALKSLTSAWPAATLRRVPRLARLALGAADQVKPETLADPDRCALLIVTAAGSVKSTFDFLDSLLDDGPELASPTAFSQAVTNMVAALVSQRLALTGPALTLTQLDRPFEKALETAALMLEAGRVDMVLLGAVEEFSPLWPAIESQAGGLSPLITMEGAVFFRLSRGQANEAKGLRLILNDDGPRPPATITTTAEEGFVNLEPLHGPGVLAPAWSLALAARLLERAGSGALLRTYGGPADLSGPVPSLGFQLAGGFSDRRPSRHTLRREAADAR